MTKRDRLLLNVLMAPLLFAIGAGMIYAIPQILSNHTLPWGIIGITAMITTALTLFLVNWLSNRCTKSEAQHAE